MSNVNWVCFDCRVAVRRPDLNQQFNTPPGKSGDGGSNDVRCPACGESCKSLGTKIAIPGTRNQSAWKKLRSRILDNQQFWDDKLSKQHVSRKHQIERWINDLQRRPENQERQRLLESLRNELDAFSH